MGSLRRISLAGLFALVAGGCVYVPPEIYYGRAPRERHRNYYVEEPRYMEPGPGPRYRDPEWERQQQLERDERRGYRDERNGRARTDRYEDRYAEREGERERDSRDRRGPELEPEPRRQTTPPPTNTPRREETVTRNESSKPVQPEKKEVMTGSKTSNPNRVKSPYAPYNELDITGLKSGSLARDPTTGQVFRVP